MTHKLAMISKFVLTRNFFYNAKSIMLVLLLTLISSCQKEQDYTVHTFKINDGWGYIIKSDNKILIKQSSIPAISSIIHFKNEKDALKVGHLVTEKIKNNLAPHVTRNDLILLKIKL